ncbi:hypothetical protein [Vibrio neptunius]|uniref:hypothetical protein n=1 Tax=Vibrio neptunius TaxID=170651 RepID=UPI0012FCC961|nr:hypothetical protein [Vibrio neptunius]
MMKTSEEFRNFTASIKSAMTAFSIVGVQVDISILESELGRKRAGDVIRLIGSNLRSAKYGALVNNPMELTYKMQSGKLRLAIRQQRQRNLDKKTGVVSIYHPECAFE